MCTWWLLSTTGVWFTAVTLKLLRQTYLMKHASCWLLEQDWVLTVNKLLAGDGCRLEYVQVHC
jgi:hypothetical protein